MNIIFLDCDGVLSLMPQWREDTLEDGDHDFDRNCIERLNDLFSYFIFQSNHKDPILRIVISSSRRTGRTIEELQEIFKRRGFLYSSNIIGKTDYSLEGSRADEILNWIQFANSKINIRKYIVLDDEEVLIQDIPQENKIIIDENKGLQNEHIEKIKEYFRK